MDNDAISDIESSTSNMYNYWESSGIISNTNTELVFTLPAVPTFLFIIGDVWPIYETPDRTDLDGFTISVIRSGRTLTLTLTRSTNDTTFYIHIWY